MAYQPDELNDPFEVPALGLRDAPRRPSEDYIGQYPKEPLFYGNHIDDGSLLLPSYIYTATYGADGSTTPDSEILSPSSGVESIHAKRSSDEPQGSEDPPSKRQCISLQTPAPTGIHTSNMVLDVYNPISIEQHGLTKRRPLLWGSDPNFVGQGYLVPSEIQEEEQRANEQLLDNLYSKIKSYGTDNQTSNLRCTQDLNIDYNIHQSSMLGSPQTVSSTETDTISFPETTPNQATDRTVDENRVEDSSHSQDPSEEPPTFFWHPPSDTRILRSKPPRRMSKERKRDLHILAEKKRRVLVKGGYDDIVRLLPWLNQCTKRVQLEGVAEWRT